MSDGFGVPGEADHGKERARKADADCPHEDQCNQVDDQEPVELRADPAALRYFFAEMDRRARLRSR